MSRGHLLGLMLAGCTTTVPVVVDVPQLDEAVLESSGLVRSPRHPGVFWTHNDSGGQAELFAVTAEGVLLRRVPVLGAQAVDWEDVAFDGAGHLWIADTGNNANVRQDLTVYRVSEPDPAGTAPAVVDRTVRFRFPDQAAFPDTQAMNFDAEALFWAEGTLWLASKHRSDLDTTLYRFPATEGEVVLERVATFTVGGDPDHYGGMVTAADLHPSGRFLALLTYHAVFVFGVPDASGNWLSRLVHTVPLDQAVMDQCEGIAWDGWSLVITNERRAIHRLADPFRAARFPVTSPKVPMGGPPG